MYTLLVFQITKVWNKLFSVDSSDYFVLNLCDRNNFTEFLESIFVQVHVFIILILYRNTKGSKNRKWLLNLGGPLATNMAIWDPLFITFELGSWLTKCDELNHCILSHGKIIIIIQTMKQLSLKASWNRAQKNQGFFTLSQYLITCNLSIEELRVV